jgi:predicted amidohydrolase
MACLDGRCAPALDDPGGPGISPGARVRVLAVALHPTMEDVVTQTTWRAFVRRRFERDVIPNLATDRPNLVVMPENTTLTTAFIGERGASGRAAAGSAAAFAAVLALHTPAIDWYNARLEEDVPLGRLLGLVTTDTVWRAIEPFRELAREHGLWIALTGDVARAERTTDPAAIAALVDPAESDRSFAWEAVDADVHNQTLFISPEGEIVHAIRKAYLVPIEENGLDLSYGSLEQMRAFDLPFARVASVISKDAWMPDVLDRLALDGAALMLQPEAFSGWGIPHAEGAWGPDVVRESGWAHVMRYPEFQASVLPCWNGNLFELVFDCQTSILTQPRHDATRGAWIGQDDEVGYARVAPWAIDDDRTGTLDERRARLIAHGERLAPGSGDPLENQYADGSVFLDLDLARPWPARTPAPGELAAAPSDAGEQRRPAIVATGEPGSFFLAWEDTRRGRTRLYGALGRVEGDAIVLGEARVRAHTRGEPRRPRLAARGDEVHLVWQETREDGSDVDAMHAFSRDGGRSFSTPSPLGDPSARSAAQWTPDVAVDPESGEVWAVWVDRSGVGARLFVARGRGGQLAPQGPVEPAVEGPYTTRANRHLPAIAVRGAGAVLAWTDFRSYRWEIFASRFESGRWSAPFRADDAHVDHEVIHSDPRIALSAGGDLVVWTDLRVRRPDYDVRAAFLGSDAALPSQPLASTDRAGRPQWRPAVAADGMRVVVVFQDMRIDHQTLRCAFSEDGGASFGPDRPLFPEDDGVDRYNPEVIWIDGARALVAYETTASGARRIGLALVTP